LAVSIRRDALGRRPGGFRRPIESGLVERTGMARAASAAAAGNAWISMMSSFGAAALGCAGEFASPKSEVLDEALMVLGPSLSGRSSQP
jgi:hypothetical protein